MRPTWLQVASSWAHVGPSWLQLGSSWINVGFIFGSAAAYLSQSGTNLDPSWFQVGLSWVHVGPKLAPTCLKLGLCWSHLQVPSRSYFETSRKMLNWKLSSFKMEQKNTQNASMRVGPQQYLGFGTPHGWILEATLPQLGLQYRNSNVRSKKSGMLYPYKLKNFSLGSSA